MLARNLAQTRFLNSVGLITFAGYIVTNQSFENKERAKELQLDFKTEIC